MKIRGRAGRPYLHHDAIASICNRHTLFVFKHDAPDGLGGDELSYWMAGLDIPNLNPAVATTANNTCVVELKACDAIVVGGKSMYWAHLL